MSDPPSRRLAGQIALVTGSARGIGRTIAEWLAREGAKIVVSGRERGSVEQSSHRHARPGRQGMGCSGRPWRVNEAHRLAQAALSRVHQLDILVNNAGMSIRGHFWEVSDGRWEKQINLNNYLRK